MAEGEVLVGMAEVKTARAPLKLAAYGLGSCVGVALWEKGTGLGGFAHVMLPSSLAYPNASVAGKYADTAIEFLLGELRREGADPSRLQAKLVGGANMFVSIVQNPVPIGLRNVAAAREKLEEKKVPLLAEAVGGGQGRTVVFYPEDGRLEIRKMNQPSEWI